MKSVRKWLETSTGNQQRLVLALWSTMSRIAVERSNQVPWRLFWGISFEELFSKVRRGDPVRWWWQSYSPLLEPHTLEHVAVPWSRAGWPSSGLQVLEKASNSSSTRNLDGVRLDMWKPKHSFSPGVCWHPFKERLLMTTLFFRFFQLSLWPIPGQRACGEFIMPRKIFSCRNDILFSASVVFPHLKQVWDYLRFYFQLAVS